MDREQVLVPATEWVLVPKEPTEEMVKAAWDDSGNVSRFGQEMGIVNRYRKMIAARPKNAPHPIPRCNQTGS